MIEEEEIKTLRAIADRLGSGERMSDGQRRDLSHRLWLVVNAIEARGTIARELES